MPLVHVSSDSLLFSVETSNDVVPIQTRVKRFALESGFSKDAAWSLAIAMSEVVSNIAKYAPRGTLSLIVEEGPPLKIIFEALDEGDGIPDLDFAKKDRVTAGVDLSKWEELSINRLRTGLGLGIGTIERMVDKVTFENRDTGGLRVWGYKTSSFLRCR